MEAIFGRPDSGYSKLFNAENLTAFRVLIRGLNDQDIHKETTRGMAQTD